MTMIMPETILHFWFEEIEPAQWWKKSDDFDRLIMDRFSDLHSQASQCELFEWRESSRGRLAEILILDQFSRNMFRGSAASFANDALSLSLAQEAIRVGADTELSATQRVFLYLPFMHSESLTIHSIAVDLYTKNGISANLDFEMRHKEIIERFGRYPHRNDILGRESTPEEKEFLTQPGSGF
jgi:uncharacterized protein (DUF924 family)